jgi:[DsrC]-trisulfide reductase subunit J
MRRLIISLLVLFGLLAGGVHAGEDGTPSYIPGIPKAVGPPHPEGNEFWRINHMNLLRKDRDLTMRLGDRNIDASIKGCVVCHAVFGPDAEPLPFENPQNFCAVCHQYVSVQIGCFTCHKSTPDEEIRARLLSMQAGILDPAESAANEAALLEYLNKLSGTGKPAKNPPPEADQ